MTLFYILAAIFMVLLLNYIVRTSIAMWCNRKTLSGDDSAEIRRMIDEGRG